MLKDWIPQRHERENPIVALKTFLRLRRVKITEATVERELKADRDRRSLLGVKMMEHRCFLGALILLGSLACSAENGGEPGRRAGDSLPAESFAAEGATRNSGRAEAAGVGAIGVHAARAHSGSIHSVIANTMLEPSRKVAIHAELQAIVEQVLVEEGSPVRQGQVLARLQDREIRNEHRQAQLAVEQAALALQQTEVKANLSAVTHQRAVALFGQALASRQDVDQAALASKSDELTVEVAKREHEARKARLEAALIHFEHTEVRSSIDGILTERLINVGDRVQVLQPVFTVEDFFPLLAPIFVTERDLAQLRVGQTARVRLEVFPDQEFDGIVRTIGPTVNAASRTVKVMLEIREGRQRLRPGLFGTVSILPHSRALEIVVSQTAVISEGDDHSVFVIGANDRVQRRPVALGARSEDRVEIPQGVSEGEIVVTWSEKALADGDLIRVVRWESATDARTGEPDRPH